MKTIIECSSHMAMPPEAEPTEEAEGYGCNACQYILNNKVHRCNKFVGLEGSHPQTGERLKDNYRCADEWNAILLVDASGTNRGQTAAIESFRNEIVKTNKQMVQALTLGAEAIKDQPRLRALPTKSLTDLPLAPGKSP